MFHKIWVFFHENKKKSFSTLHFDEIFTLKFENLKHAREIRENDVGDKKKCLRNV